MNPSIQRATRGHDLPAARGMLMDVADFTSTYRATFITKTIAPARVPTFQYMASGINHDTLEYIAILDAKDVDTALAAITELWPDATPVMVEAGHGMKFESRSMTLKPLGMLPVVPEPVYTRWDKFKHWFGVDLPR